MKYSTFLIWLLVGYLSRCCKYFNMTLFYLLILHTNYVLIQDAQMIVLRSILNTCILTLIPILFLIISLRWLSDYFFLLTRLLRLRTASITSFRSWRPFYRCSIIKFLVNILLLNIFLLSPTNIFPLILPHHRTIIFSNLLLLLLMNSF